ncbi:MAG: hypothetical protein ACRDL8_19225 [Solirubrobacteraceae bacterium]
MAADCSVPEHVRRVAGRLAEAFDSDQQLAQRQNQALARLRDGNGQLWSGLDPEALGLLYDDTHAVGDPRRGDDSQPGHRGDRRCPQRRCDDHAVETAVVRVVQELHWTIHRALSDYQQASEDRRQPAAEIGELTAVGWSEQEARSADVRALSAAGAR